MRSSASRAAARTAGSASFNAATISGNRSTAFSEARLRTAAARTSASSSPMSRSSFSTAASRVAVAAPRRFQASTESRYLWMDSTAARHPSRVAESVARAAPCNRTPAASSFMNPVRLLIRRSETSAR